MVTLNKNYSKMGGTDAPASIDDTNQTQMTEIETDMTTVESAINNHEANTSNPHSVDKSQVGLGNVPNVDATDCDNHTSGTTNKVFSATEQTKLAGIEDGAEVNDVNSVAGKTGTVTLEEADITDLDHDAQKIKSIPVDTTGISGGDYLAYDATNTEFKPATPGTPSAHASSHEDGGVDEINVAGLSGELADPQPAKAHASTHQNGGADEIDLTGLSGKPADLSTHENDTTTHGTTGDIVGTTDSQTLTNKTFTSPTVNGDLSGDAILDEDDMSSDSNTKVPTQQSVKAYVDNKGMWQSWTPTWTNLTVGNGTVEARYTQIGKTIHAIISFAFESTSSIDGRPEFTLPVSRKTYADDSFVPMGLATFHDSGSMVYLGRVVSITSASSAAIVAEATSSTYNQWVYPSSTVPMTWAAGDDMNIVITYEAA